MPEKNDFEKASPGAEKLYSMTRSHFAALPLATVLYFWAVLQPRLPLFHARLLHVCLAALVSKYP